jgi:hypothetical protein
MASKSFYPLAAPHRRPLKRNASSWPNWRRRRWESSSATSPRNTAEPEPIRLSALIRGCLDQIDTLNARHAASRGGPLSPQGVHGRATVRLPGGVRFLGTNSIFDVPVHEIPGTGSDVPVLEGSQSEAQNRARRCKLIAERAGLDPEGFDLKNFRFTNAISMLRRGFDVRTVQDWMGHKSLETTMRYLVPAPDVHDRLDLIRLPGNGSVRKQSQAAMERTRPPECTS